MAFNTLHFLFVFFPICLLLYALVPKFLKNIVLLLLSLLFFSWGNPQHLLLLICSIAFNYFACLEMDSFLEQERQNAARVTLVSSVVFNLLLLCFFKYGVKFIRGAELTMPMGVSFYTFSLLSSLFDVYRKKAPAITSIIDFGVFVSFFPKFVSGPIVPYHQFEPQLKNHPYSPTLFGGGARKLIIGLSKKLLIADVLGTTFYQLADMAELSAAGAWLCVISYSLMLYFDFSGYSDMAIGLAGMFGFRIPANFTYPYLADSLSDFWRRWHISLGAWFRDYVYIPLGGSRKGTTRTIGNLMIVWLLTGIWHGTGGGFLIWGVYYGILLILEKFVFATMLTHIPKWIRTVLTVFLVMIGWVFFFSPTPSSAFHMLGQLFGRSGFLDGTARYYWSSTWRLLIIAIAACFPIASNLGRKVMAKSPGWIPLSVIYYGVLLLLCVAAMMNATYTSFLYFQF